MKKTRWQAAVGILAVLALASLLAGCFEYTETIAVKADGSGTVEIDASIPEDVAAKFRAPGTTTAPVSAGVIMQRLLIGSPEVQVVERVFPTQPFEGKWTYRLVLAFPDLSSLSRVRYFSNRAFRMEFVGNKEVRFSQTLRPHLVQLAKDQAVTLPDDAYARLFLASIDAPDFFANYGLNNTKVVHKVVLSGTNGRAENAEEILPGRDDTVVATWSYSMGDLAAASSPPNMRLQVRLPAETGPMMIIMTLLLASIVGILIPAIRLLVLKLHGMN